MVDEHASQEVHTARPAADEDLCLKPADAEGSPPILPMRHPAPGTLYDPDDAKIEVAPAALAEFEAATREAGNAYFAYLRTDTGRRFWDTAQELPELRNTIRKFQPARAAQARRMGLTNWPSETEEKVFLALDEELSRARIRKAQIEAQLLALNALEPRGCARDRRAEQGARNQMIYEEFEAARIAAERSVAEHRASRVKGRTPTPTSTAFHQPAYTKLIAQKHGLSDRQVRSIVESERKRQREADPDRR